MTSLFVSLLVITLSLGILCSATAAQDSTNREPCTSVLGWPRPAPSAGGVTCWPSESAHRTLSSESMEEAELTETPDAEVTEERDEWTIERA